MTHSETSLQRDMDVYRSLLDKSIDGMVAFDTDLRYTHWNTAMERLTGLMRDQVVGHSIFDVFPDLVASGDDRRFYEVLQGRSFELCNTGIRLGKHGKYGQFDIHFSPMYDAQGAVCGGAVIVHDVSQQKRVEHDLQASKERVSLILESITDAFFAVDQHWNFTYVNHEAALLLNRDRRELIGLNVWNEFSEAVTMQFFEQYHHAMQEQVVVQFEEYYPPLDTWFEVSAYPSKDGLSVYFRDVTARKNAQDESEQHYRSLFEQHPDAVFSFDLQGRYLSMNKAMERVTGYTADELLHRTFLPLVTEGDMGRILHHFQRAAEGTPQMYEASILHKSGSIIEVHVTNIPIIVNDKVVGVYGIAKDITERKRTEEELRATKELLESFLQNNADAIWWVDLEDRVQRSNPAFAKMFGWEEAEIQGQKLPIIPDQMTAEIQVLHRRVKQGASISGFQTKRQRKDGTLVDVSATLTPIRDKNGEVVGMTSVCRDISERKKTEEMLLRSEKLAVAGQLAAGVAHEIRNPLTALKGFVQLMQYGEHAKGKYLEVMASELNRIDLIVSELLVLAKPQANTFKRKDVIEILENVITISETQALLSNVEILTDYAAGIEPLDCDENQLKQVFINFMKNAIESMQQGGQLTVSVKRNGQNEVVIRFQDQGCGIPKEILERLGEPFYTTKEKGTGLGLMVSHKIIENHRGRIVVTSELNVGTTVDVILPFGSSNE